METTPTIHLPLIMPSQAQKHVTHNEALLLLDGIVQLSVIDRHLASPPSSPAEGNRYIVAAGATGAWAGWDLDIALWSDGAWLRLEPIEGWLTWIQDEDLLVAWNGGGWMPAAAGNGTFGMVGANTSPDSTNRLAAKSDAVLLSHDDVTPGSGDMRLKANKSASAKTASVIFQTASSGRAEVGLTGSDDLKIKVSADGTTWKDAIVVNRTTGVVSMPFTPALQILTAENTSGTSMPDGTFVNQAFLSTTHNAFGSGAWNGTTFTVPAAGIYDVSACLNIDGSPNNLSMYFFKNGATILGFSEHTGGAGQNTILSRAVISLAASDTILVRLRHDAGSSQPGLVSSALSIIKIG